MFPAWSRSLTSIVATVMQYIIPLIYTRDEIDALFMPKTGGEFTGTVEGTAFVADSFRFGSGSVQITSPTALSIAVNRALIMARFTTAQLPSPSATYAGAVVYNTDTDKLNVCNGSTWEEIASA